MSEHENEDFELDGHALAMIAAYRQEEALPAEVSERVWDRVQSDAGAPVAPTSAAAKWGVVLVAAAAAIAIAVIGGRALVSSEEEAAAPQQAPYGHTGDPDGGAVELDDDASRLHVEREAVPPQHAVIEPADATEPEDVDTAEAAAVPTPDAAAPSEPERNAKPRARRAPREETRTPPELEPPPPPADTLADETRLLGRARGALAASRPRDALAILDEYTRRFPDGRLAPERAALRVIALCDAGRHAEGSRAADAFLAAHSGHALASRVRGACDR